MPKGFFARKLMTFIPTDAQGEEALRELGQGEIIEITWKHVRNLKFHRRYWVLLTLVYENLPAEIYPTIEDFHEAVKIMAGCRIRYWLPPGAEVAKPDGSTFRVGKDGIWLYRPGSIAFHKMDEKAFREFYENVSDLLSKYFLPGVRSADLRKQVEGLLVDRR